jgi:hypothetical protein
VCGFDIRTFGKSTGEPRGLINDFGLLKSDSKLFMDAFCEWDNKRGFNQPFIGYGYSLGGTYLSATYQHLAEFPAI